MPRAVPPLIAIAEGRKARARKVIIPAPKELSLHMSVADLLRKLCKPTWLWNHIPSGEIRNYRTACKLKAMGHKGGWPDIVLLPPSGTLHCLELKRLGEDLNDNQKAFRLHCIQHGIPHVVAYSLDDVAAAFNTWGCLTVPMTMRSRGNES